MALWDNISKNASGTAAKAVQQAKNITEVSKLNALISDEKREIENIFGQLGRLYADTHREDFEPEFADLMGALLHAEQTIAGYQERIQLIRGVVTCPACGAEVPRGVAFCSNCGTPLPRKQEAPAAARACANCGAPLGENVRFCTSCGAPAVNPEPVEAEPVVEIPLCPTCGSELDSDSIFCAECGTRVK